MRRLSTVDETTARVRRPAASQAASVTNPTAAILTTVGLVAGLLASWTIICTAWPGL